MDKEEADGIFDGTEERLCELVVLGKVSGEVFLRLLGERVGLDHQIQDCGWYGQGIEVALDFLFVRVFDVGVVYHERNSISLVVGILDGC
jgi:hypothetical protein